MSQQREDESMILDNGEKVITGTSNLDSALNKGNWADFRFPLSTSDLGSILTEFYLLHNAEKISTIPMIIEKYESNQLELFRSLKERYNITVFKPFDDIIAKHDSAFTSGPILQVTNQPEDGASSIAGTFVPRLQASSVNAGKSLSAALTLNMQDIAGVSSNLLSGTAGRLFTGVSWGLSVANTSTPTNTQTGPIQSSSPDSPVKAMSADSVDTTGGGTAEEGAPATASWTPGSNTGAQSADVTDGGKSEGSDKTASAAAIAILKKENSYFRNESLELKSKVDSLQQQIMDLVERESAANKELRRLSDKLKSAESAASEILTKLEATEKLAEERKSQLMNCLDTNYRLALQLEFVVVEAHRGLSLSPISSSGGQGGTDMKESSPEGQLQQQLSKEAPSAFRELFAAYLKEASVYYRNFNNDSDVSSLPETEPKVPASNPNDLPPLKEQSLSRLTEELLQTKKIAEMERASFLVGGLQLTAALRRADELSNTALRQQAQIETLRTQLEIAEEEKKSLHEKLAELQEQGQVAAEQLQDVTRELRAFEAHHRSMKIEHGQALSSCRQLSEALSLCEDSKKDLIRACNDVVRANETKCNSVARQLKESLSLEREDFFSRLRGLAELRATVAEALSEEAARDLQRLKDEAFRARRAELQKDRQLVFLQGQLKEAASRLSLVTAELDKEREKEKGRSISQR